jgi:ATP-dependent RNA helicase RhlE
MDQPARPTASAVGRKVFVTTATSHAAESQQTDKTAASKVTFASLQLATPILDALVADGYEFPTPIQAQSIPPALAKRDVLGIAQTGTGKTAAFALPILNRLLREIPRGSKLPAGRKAKALVLAPTRELAAQIAESFAAYGRHTPLRFAVIFGGVGQGPQVRAIQQGLDILVATPGRLIDLLDQRLVSLDAIEFFVLDEADRMLDMGFIEPIRRIAALVPAERQNMLFSATMPKEIRRLADTLLVDPVTVTVTPVSSAVDRIDQLLYFVLKAQKTQLLIHLFDEMKMERTVVFTKTKHGADRLTRKLKAAGIRAEAIHGDKAQNQRIRALDAFRSGRSPVLVATDVAARGLDIDDITHVVNFDLPMEPEAYVHRIGRTARAGKSGHAISFCDVEEKGLLRQIERLTKFDIPRARVPGEVPKSDEAAAKAGLAPLPPREERVAREEPRPERAMPPAERPRLNARGRPMPKQPMPGVEGRPAHAPRDSHADARREAGPRGDRPRADHARGTNRADRTPHPGQPHRGHEARERELGSERFERPAPSRGGPGASGAQSSKKTPGFKSASLGQPAHGKPANGKPVHGKSAPAKPRSAGSQSSGSRHGGTKSFGAKPSGPRPGGQRSAKGPRRAPRG